MQPLTASDVTKSPKLSLLRRMDRRHATELTTAEPPLQHTFAKLVINVHMRARTVKPTHTQVVNKLMYSGLFSEDRLYACAREREREIREGKGDQIQVGINYVHLCVCSRIRAITWMRGKYNFYGHTFMRWHGHYVFVSWMLTSQQQARVSHGRICLDNCMCCRAEIEAASSYLTQSQFTDTGLTNPSADPIQPGG